MTGNREFRDVRKFAAKLGITPEKLIKVFEIERDFHSRILREEDGEKRKEMYREVYETVHRIYGTQPVAAGAVNPKDRIVRLFRKELSGKSILEVGCGNGLFLQSVARLLPHRDLVGLDISAPVLPAHQDGIRFVRADIIDFTTQEKFDVVFSEHVIEHIAPADLPAHLDSLNNALAEDGVLIVCAPNGNFGPSDVTRILDRSHMGRTAAMGTHLHEPTHRELMDMLRRHGFNTFKTVFPFMKVRNYLGFVRFNANFTAYIEGNPTLMKFLHSIRYRGRCIARFDTVLICGKG